MKKMLATICILLIIAFNLLAQSHDNSKLTGPYLGQEPPGKTPVVFAPGIVSSGLNEHSCTFSPDGKEFYFTRILNDVPSIMYTSQASGFWITPKAVTFSGKYLDRLPQMSHDGTTIYFQSRRPEPGHSSPGEISIWISKRNDSGHWAEPKPLEAELGMKNADISVTVSGSGTLYASGIIRLHHKNGGYTKPEKLIPDLKGTYPFIAPDESYILFCSGKQRDLAVSFRRPDDTWTEPQLILQQPKPFWIQGFPVVSPDGRYLFFTADHDIYWVSADIIERLRPSESK